MAVTVAAAQVVQQIRNRVSYKRYRPVAVVKIDLRLRDAQIEDEQIQSEADPFAPLLGDLRHQQTHLLDQVAIANVTGDRAAQREARINLAKVHNQIEAIKSGKPPPEDTSFEQRLDALRVTLYIAVTDMTIGLNSFRIADELTAGFPFKDCPISQDIFRAARVEAYMGTVPESDFANPRTWRLPLTQQNLMFRGYVDTWEDCHDAGKAEVQIRARSIDAILMDAKTAPVNATRLIKHNMPITAFVNEFLAEFPQFSGAFLGGDSLTCIMDPTLSRLGPDEFGPPSVPEPLLTKQLLARALQTAQSANKAMGAVDGQTPPVGGVTPDMGGTVPGADLGAGQARMPPPTVSSDLKAWDVIVAACELVGLMPVFDSFLDPNHIVLKFPSTVFETPEAGVRYPNGAPDGFKRTLYDKAGHPFESDVRFLVWGRDIKSLKRSRKIGRITAPAIQVKCYNPDATPDKQLLTAIFPTKHRYVKSTAGADGAQKAKVGGKVSEVHTLIVHGIRSEEDLKRIAISTYHSIARQETSVKIETKDMDSFVDPRDPGAPAATPDLLTLRSGTAIRVMIAKKKTNANEQQDITPLSAIFDTDEAALAKLLAGQKQRFAALPPDTATLNNLAQREAAAVAQASSSFPHLDLYYVRTVNHRFSNGDGWSAEIEAVNFRDASLPSVLGGEDAAADAALQPQPRAQAAAKRRDPATRLGPMRGVPGNNEEP